MIIDIEANETQSAKRKAESRAVPYPLDYAALKKGGAICTEDCEHYLQVTRDHPRYDLKLLGFVDTINEGCAKAENPLRAVKCKDYILICTDEQASARSFHNHKKHVRKIAQELRWQRVVDTSNLSAPALQAHEHNTRIQAFTVQAIRKAKRDAVKEIDAQEKKMLPPASTDQESSL